MEPVIKTVDPRALKAARKNARRMQRALYQRLVNNIKADNALLSVPLVVEREGELEIISGHHRIKAAIEAGLKTVQVMVLDGAQLTKDKQTAMQLSHNAIEGEDDEALLAELYESIRNMADKEYSGLTDEVLGVEQMISCEPPNPDFHIHVFLFTKADEAVIEDAFNACDEMAAEQVHAMPLSDFDVFLSAISDVKRRFKILGHSTALRVLCEHYLETAETVKVKGHER